MKGYRLEILVDKISEDKNSSFWYHNLDVAKVDFMNGKRLFLESRGEIRVQLKEDEGFLKGGQAVDRAIELDYTDVHLNNLIEDDAWDNNNWFAVVMVDINGEVISDDLALGDDYDDGIEQLKAVADEEFKKMYN